MGDVADNKIKEFFQCLADACKSVEMMASTSSTISDSITVGLVLAGAIGGYFFRSVRIGTVVGSTVACFVNGARSVSQILLGAVEGLSYETTLLLRILRILKTGIACGLPRFANLVEQYKDIVLAEIQSFFEGRGYSVCYNTQYRPIMTIEN